MKEQLFDEIRKQEKQMTFEEEVPLFIMAQTGCTTSFNQLLANHSRFAIFEAAKYQSPQHEDDLIQCSLLGLSEAIYKFDTQKGVKFISFAVWYIKKHISEYWQKNAQLIRLPAFLSDGHIYASTFSYDSNEENLIDSMFASEDDIYNDLEKEEEKKKNQINVLLSNLNNSQRQVIFLRLTTNMTYGEIAEKLGYTSENARQHFVKGIKKLKNLYSKEQLINIFY